MKWSVFGYFDDQIKIQIQIAVINNHRIDKNWNSKSLIV